MADNITAREALESLRDWIPPHYGETIIGATILEELDRRIAALPPETTSVVDAACAKLRDEEREGLVQDLRNAMQDDKTPSIARACARLLLHEEVQRGR